MAVQAQAALRLVRYSVAPVFEVPNGSGDVGGKGMVVENAQLLGFIDVPTPCPP